MNRNKVVDISGTGGLVPVFYHPDSNVAIETLAACYDGGCRIFEFTNRGEAAPEVFSRLNEYRNKHLPDMILGARTIMDVSSRRLFISLGADFTVSPILNEELLSPAVDAILHIPGCGTVTEIDRAERQGASLIKLFPAEILSPKFIRAVHGPMPGRKLMPSGGVYPEIESIRSWIEAGAHCLGMGSALFTKKWMQQPDMKSMSELVSSVLSMIREVRND